MDWLQNFCDSLVETSLQSNACGRGKRSRGGSIAGGGSQEHRPEEFQALLEQAAKRIAPIVASSAAANAAPSVSASLNASEPPTASSACTPLAVRARELSQLLTPTGCALTAQDLLEFDVEELLRLVASTSVRRTDAVLASPRGKPLVTLSPSQLLMLEGAQAAKEASAPQGANAPRGRSTNMPAPPPRPEVSWDLAHRLFPSPVAPNREGAAGLARLDMQELSKTPSSELPTPTPGRGASFLGLGSTSAPRKGRGNQAATPRCKGPLTPRTPASARMSQEELLGFLNLDGLMSPVMQGAGHNAGKAATPNACTLVPKLSPGVVIPEVPPEANNARALELHTDVSLPEGP